MSANIVILSRRTAPPLDGLFRSFFRFILPLDGALPLSGGAPLPFLHA
jgi:hypothetical protein